MVTGLGFICTTLLKLQSSPGNCLGFPCTPTLSGSSGPIGIFEIPNYNRIKPTWLFTCVLLYGMVPDGLTPSCPVACCIFNRGRCGYIGGGGKPGCDMDVDVYAGGVPGREIVGDDGLFTTVSHCIRAF